MTCLVFFSEKKYSPMGKYIQPKTMFEKLCHFFKLKGCLTSEHLILQIYSFCGNFKGQMDKISQVGTNENIYLIISSQRKKYFSREKAFATEELNIFAGAKFRECYQTKYFVVPNIRDFVKRSRNHETFFYKSFLL